MEVSDIIKVHDITYLITPQNTTTIVVGIQILSYSGNIS